ncbi:nuclear transport factor 2 family protein [Niveibacterium sp. SC-1]|uniref:nuclear transport factor 2 family protein n=1 Tax=Niveibacterium sp. SC-1 TaxID=3135646 RepID=UPI00311F2411
MYAMIVERIVRNAFDALNRGEMEPVLARFHPDGVLRFPGEDGLGAECRGLAQVRPWFQRFRALFPHLQFQIHEVSVHGLPWNTRVFTRFTDRIPFPDGTVFINHGVQYLRLVWGRVREDVIYVDTQTVARARAHAAREAGR